MTLFSRLLVVGQQRSVDIADVFQFELSSVPPALIDEYGCLRKGDNADNSKNKDLLNNILCSYPLPHNIQLVDMLDCVVTHDEADVTLCSYMLKAVAVGDQTIRILSDDTGVFVLFVYWTSRMRFVAKIQMEKWNGDILDINETVQRLGPKKCSQPLGIHALSN